MKMSYKIIIILKQMKIKVLVYIVYLQQLVQYSQQKLKNIIKN